MSNRQKRPLFLCKHSIVLYQIYVFEYNYPLRYTGAIQETEEFFMSYGTITKLHENVERFFKDSLS